MSLAETFSSQQQGIGWKHTLDVIPVKNAAAKVNSWGKDGILVEVQLKTPRFLIPPFSWLIKLRKSRQFVLSGIGKHIWDLCNGRDRLETIIDFFAQRYQLSFHEARIAVIGYLRDLVLRGIIILVVEPIKESS